MLAVPRIEFGPVKEMNNVQRHRDDEIVAGDTVWAHWSRNAHVVLTQ